VKDAHSKATRKNGLTFALLSLTLYVIIVMEYPRVGLIRVTAMDRV